MCPLQFQDLSARASLGMESPSSCSIGIQPLPGGILLPEVSPGREMCMWEMENCLLPQFLYMQQGKIFPPHKGCYIPLGAGVMSLNTSMELPFENTLTCMEGEFPFVERGQASLERDNFKGQGYGLVPDQNPFPSTTCSC